VELIATRRHQKRFQLAHNRQSWAYVEPQLNFEAAAVIMLGGD